MAKARRKLKARRAGDVGREPASQRFDGAAPAELLHLLDHPVRRQILRFLDGDGCPRSPRELAELIEASLSNVSYHVWVLEDREAVRPIGVQPVEGTKERFFASAVSGNELVAAILSYTEKEDRKVLRKPRRGWLWRAKSPRSPRQGARLLAWIRGGLGSWRRCRG